MDWLIMRPAIEGMGSLIEIETLWSIEDVYAAHRALDARDEMRGVLVETVLGAITGGAK